MSRRVKSARLEISSSKMNRWVDPAARFQNEFKQTRGGVIGDARVLLFVVHAKGDDIDGMFLKVVYAQTVTRFRASQ